MIPKDGLYWKHSLLAGGVAVDRLQECMARQDWQEAWLQFRRLTEGSAVPPTADLLLLGAKVARRLGNLYAAAHLIDRAIALLPAEAGPLHAQVWFAEGLIYREVGDLYRAIPALERVIRNAAAYPDLAPVLLGATHYNIALAYRQRHDHLLSLSHYTQAADLFRQEGQHGYLVQTLHNMAWIYCLDDNPAGADHLLAEAEPLVRTEMDGLHQRVGRAHVLLLQGQIPDALRMLREVVERLDAADPDEAAALAVAQYVAGEACRRVGLLEQALLFAAEADRAALRAQDARLMNLACNLRAAVLRMKESAD
jgi:tetratricopeptide (TPR) repeat protein